MSIARELLVSMSGVGSGHGARPGLAWPAHWDLGAATVPTISHLKTLIGTGGTGGGNIYTAQSSRLDKQSHSLIFPNDSFILS